MKVEKKLKFPLPYYLMLLLTTFERKMDVHDFGEDLEERDANVMNFVL